MVPRLLRHAGRDSSEAHALAKLLGQLDESRAQRRRGHPNLVLQQKILACKLLRLASLNADVPKRRRNFDGGVTASSPLPSTSEYGSRSHSAWLQLWLSLTRSPPSVVNPIRRVSAGSALSGAKFGTETGSKHALKPMHLRMPPGACRSNALTLQDLQRAARRKNGGAPGPAGWAQDDVAALPLDASTS